MRAVRRRAAIFLLGGLALFAQGDGKRLSDTSSLEQRMAVIETKLDNLRALDDRVSKLNDKIDTQNLQLAAINTKLEIIQWLGGTIGLLVLGSLWSSLTEKRNSRLRDTYDRAFRNARELDFSSERPFSFDFAKSPSGFSSRVHADELQAAYEAGKQAHREESQKEKQENK